MKKLLKSPWNALRSKIAYVIGIISNSLQVVQLLDSIHATIPIYIHGRWTSERDPEPSMQISYYVPVHQRLKNKPPSIPPSKRAQARTVGFAPSHPNSEVKKPQSSLVPPFMGFGSCFRRILSCRMVYTDGLRLFGGRKMGTLV